MIMILGTPYMSGGKVVSRYSPNNISEGLPDCWLNAEAGKKVFISHLSNHKQYAEELSRALSKHGFYGFVAHLNIKPTTEWLGQIEKALFNMDVFISIHHKDYSKSNWCQQEIGFACARKISSIALRIGEDPTGFISRHQAIIVKNQETEALVQEIIDYLN